MAKIKVLIVDDHGVVRQGLSVYLGLLDEIAVVGEAANGIEALEKAKELQPDVVLMDLVMPKMGGIEAIRQLRIQSPNTKVIVLTSFTEDDKVFPAIQAGATSYLLKDVKPPELAAAIVAAHHGESHLHPEVTRKLMSQVSQRTEIPADVLPHEDLTERELEVLILIARGLSNRELALNLSISEKTVKTHVSNILSKLNVSDRTQAAIYAHKHGLVPADGESGG